MIKLKKSKGFTLVELLVVIAIIGVLSSVILVAMTSARAKSRDAKRLGDVKALQSAVELYRDGNRGKAPANLADLAPTYIASIPCDPLEACSTPGTGYTYTRGTGSNIEETKFSIKFITESDGALGAAADGTAASMCATSKQVHRVSGATCPVE
jgi:prepilin-type N-terminal cleavage/methylation domain-containing protein